MNTLLNTLIERVDGDLEQPGLMDPEESLRDLEALEQMRDALIPLDWALLSSIARPYGMRDSVLQAQLGHLGLRPTPDYTYSAANGPDDDIGF